DYTEKKNTIARALEDLKANFYCELCDKQYYKHQEFDNHINSYDHAHKQRLKELKQREFARNVASKSRRDERKQEKALQRLHRLAELRKERTCAPGSGPMFKSTTVTVRDHGAGVLQSTALDPGDRQDSCCTLMHNTQDCKDITSVISSTPGNVDSHKSDLNKCGDQVQVAQGHRVGFSFAFPKKAAVKLESSAAVFYEYNDEMSAEHGFSRRSRFVPGAGNLQSPPVAEVVPCLEDKQNCCLEKSVDAAEASEAQVSQDVASENSRVLEIATSVPAVSHSNQVVSSDVDGDGVDGSAAELLDQILPVVVDGTQVLPLGCSGYELQANRALAQAVVEDCLSLQDVMEGRKSDSSTAETETQNLEADVLVPSPSEEGGSGAPQSKLDVRKWPCEPFVPVLSKHGSNVLQWPSEMLIYTRTDPSISYSCNPLYFDFRSSRASDSQEKSKHQPNIPHLHHKTESGHSLISDFTNAPTSECGNYEAELDSHLCSCTIPLSSDIALIRNGDLAKNQSKVSLGESFRIRKPERCHLSRNHLRQNTVIDEKYSNICVKESHEKRLHKSRRWKRRRKFCHCHCHHCGDTAVAEMLSSVSEEEIGYKNENKYQTLQSSPENPNKCRHNVGNIWVATGEMQQLHQNLSSENDHKMFTSASDHTHRDRGWCDIWSPKSSVQHHHSCKQPHGKSKASSRRQARQQAPSCRRHRSRYSKTCCSWKVRRLSCSPERRCLGHCTEEKSPSQTQPMKRGYNVLTEEPEKSHRKRRQHAYSTSSSSSSDESLYEQTLSADECLRQACAHHKAKGKHRRRKTRISHLFLGRNAKCGTSGPPEESPANPASSTVGNLTQVSQEEPSAAPKADLTADTEEAMQLEETRSPIEADSPHRLEEGKLTVCTATDNVPSVSSDVIACSDAAPVVDHSAPAAASTQDVLQDEKREESVNSCENPGPYKGPLPNRYLDQIPPKSYLCRYELPESLPHEKINEVTSEWVQCSPGIFSSPPPLPFKEAHVHSHTFLTTEQLIAPFALPEQTLIFPPDNHEKFKDLPSEPYQQIIPQNLLANKVKFTFPPPAIQPPTSPLQPLPLQPPLCSTSVTTIHHTILQQHAAAASTLKVLQPHQQFLSQVPALSRAPLPHLPVGPRLCPGAHAAFVSPPHLPLLQPSVLHPTQLAFSPLPPTVFPSLLSPHPAVIPLQPLF
ncbi:Z804A protein, partial [Upupa epops]|nr:Z804A protein [Upupa epops]